MAEFTKDGITISQDSGTGNAELKLKVANPPYQEFNDKRVEFTIGNTDYSVSKALLASLKGINVWGWGEDYGIDPVLVGSSVEDLSFSITGRGNILSYKQVTSSTKAEIYIKKSKPYENISVKSLKLFIPSIDNENPIMTLSNWDGSLTYLYSYENWPDAEWASQNGGIYEWRIDMELDPNTESFNKDIEIEFGSLSTTLNVTPFIKVVQPPTEIISLNPGSVTLAADGTESSVQLSTVGAWTVE